MTWLFSLLSARRWNVVTLLLGTMLSSLVACSDTASVSGANDGSDPSSGGARCRKDIDALQALKREPRACGKDKACPSGSHCSANNTCAWECYADSDCGEGSSCGCDGVCRVRTVRSSHNEAACQAIPEQTRHATLLELNAEQSPCIDDLDCPCGAYCDDNQTCHVECIAGTNDPSYVCASGKTCNDLGQCVSASAPPDTSAVPFSIGMSPGALTADTLASAQTVTATITLESPTIAILAPANIPTVWIGIAELDDTSYTGPHPRVRCAADEPFADSCRLDKAWSFDPIAGTMKGRPRTVTVELPQTAEKLEWTLVARSRLADAATSIALFAQPASSAPASEAGFYRGTAKVGTGANAMVVPVELYVAPNDVAVYEPTRVLFPEGSMVYRRSAADTYFPWLAADTGSSTDFKVRLRPTASQFTAASKRFTSTFTIGVLSKGEIPVEIDAVHQGALPAACGTGCASGSYCQTDMNVCLPGAAPVRVVAAPTESVSSAIDSTRLTAWEQAVTAAVTNNFRLSGRDVASVERAMCYRSDAQQAPGRFGVTTTAPSRELTCSDGLPPVAFEFLNQTKSLTVNQQNVETFNLLDHCVADLAAPPSADLATPKACASLPRFFAAIRPGAGLDSTAGNRAYAGALRQWLQAHAFAARTGAQEREYDNAISGGGSAISRLEELLTLVEDGWRVALDQRVQSKLSTFWEAARADYRDVARPIHRWSFSDMRSGNLVVPDREGTNGLRITSYDIGAGTDHRLNISSNVPATCETEQAIDVGRSGLSIGAWIGAAWVGTRDLVWKDGTSSFFIRVTRATSNDQVVTVEIANGYWAGLRFVIPFESGYYVLTSSRGESRWVLYHLNSQLKVYYPEAPTSPWANAVWGAPGKLKINCQSTNSSILLMDELAIWDHELPRETVEALARAYMPTPSASPAPTGEILPPRALDLNDGAEASVGLPVHVLETASAHLDLALQYADRQREAIYSECSTGSGSSSLSQARTRLGRTLRYVLTAERVADSLVNAPPVTSTPTWRPRYDAAMQALAGRKLAVVDSLRQLTQCQNPLGVSEDDLPLYVGEAVGASERFFAGSRYLARQANTANVGAEAALTAARAAWHEQRQSQFQFQMTMAQRNERLSQIRQKYEGSLRRLCGPRADGSELLQLLIDGTISARDCYLKLEQQRCRVADQPIAKVPADCLRGELGEQIMAVKAAAIDSDNAMASLERAIDSFNAENTYCINRQAFHTESEQLLADHQEVMAGLRKKKRWLGFIRGIAQGAAQAAVGAATMNPSMIVAGSEHASAQGILFDYLDMKWTEDMIEEEEKYRAMVEKRSHELDIMACFHGADNHKYAIDAAQDVLVKAAHQLRATQLHLENATAELTAIVREASGELQAQQALGLIVPPQHHFWLDERIRTFSRKFRMAKRMTYLALRALEYEAQQSFGLRDDILTATRPDQLDAVIAAIEARNAPFQGQQGFVIGDPHPVVSLRDELLRLEDLATNTSRAPGETPRTATQMLREYLKSDSARVYANGVYKGRGLRFFFRPQEWAANSCAERIWRLTASLQIEPSPNGTQINNPVVTLFQENSFGSQYCGSGHSESLQVSRVQPTHNLFLEDADATSSFVDPPRHTGMNMTPLVNKSRAELESLADGMHEGLAGRGLYANYILLFPKEQFDDATLSRIKDVLIRIDMVEVTNANDPN